MKRNIMSVKLLVMMGVFSIMISCKNNDIFPSKISKVEGPINGKGYLHFKDGDALKKVVVELSNSKDKISTLDNILNRENSIIQVGEFKSSSEKSSTSYYTEKVVNTKENEAQRSTEGNNIDELVPDVSFATLLSSDLKIQVGDDIYQITPEGTYYTNILNQQALALMLEDDSDIANHSGEVSVGDYLYQVPTDGQYEIYRYDTFGEGETRTVDLRPMPNDYPEPSPYPGEPTPTPTPTPTPNGQGPLIPISDCGIPQPSTYVGTSAHNNIYCTFPTYAYGAKTLAGQLISSKLGVNTQRTEEFDSNHRVSVKLYNFNYFVYSSIGLKAKYQEKGWTGIWDKKDCQKIVVGWDAIIFESPLVYSQSLPAPYQQPSFPGNKIGRAVTKEFFQFVNFSVFANSISQVSSDILGSDRYSAEYVERKLTNLTGNQLGSIIKSIWNYTEKEFNPYQIEFRDSVTKAFRMIFPDKVVIAMSRWEKVKENDGEVDCLFDANTCRITYSATIGKKFDFEDDILKPTYSNGVAKSYKIQKAAIFGAALRNGQWKGVRIIQE